MNEILNVKIEKLVFCGKWFARHSDGRVIFITGWAIPESIVNLRVLKKKKDFIEAQITQIVKKSPLETESHPPMPGTPWINISYKNQLKIKQDQIIESFFHIQKYQNEIHFLPIESSPQTLGYRNKIEFSFGKYISLKEWRNEQFNVGFHKQGEFSRVEDYPNCMLIDENSNKIYKKIREFCKSTGFEAFDQKMVTGFFRHLVMRMTHHTDEIMIILSVHPKFFPDREWYLEAIKILSAFFQNLAKEHTDIKSIYISHNENKSDTSIGELELIYGKENITEQILGLKFEISPKSFFQTNTLGAERLYSIARDFLDNKEKKRNTILDLYAGTGTLGMIFSPFGKKVYSVELIKDASEDGKNNAKRNNIDNIEFICAKVEDFLKDFKKNSQKPDLLIIDPPRSWMHPDALPSILEFESEEIIYISCNPATLTRDLEMILKTWKYRIEKVQPVDMFPHTHHIEVVTSLKRI